MASRYLNYSIPKTNLSKYIFLLIFGLFLFSRLYFLPKTIPFNWDQERDAFVVYNLLNFHKPTLIGPRVVNDSGFFIGPYFYYILAPFYLLTGYHPYALIVFVFFVSIIFFILSYFTVRHLFNLKIALIFLALWSVNLLTVSIDRIAWNPILLPLSFFLILLILINIKNNLLNYLSLGIVLGLSYHFHFQSIFYFVFTFIYLYRKSLFKFKNIIYLLLGVFITFIPLIIFDLRHQWLNLNLFINFFYTSTTPSNHFQFLPVWSNFINLMFGINNNIISIVFWLLLLLYGFINRKHPYFLSSFITILITPVVFYIYGKRPSEYYFNYLLPIIFLYISHLLSNIKLKSNAIILIFFVAFLSRLSFKTNQTALFFKLNIVKQAKIILGSKPIYITFDTPIGENSGFSYLITYFNINSQTNTNYPNVQFIIPKRNNLLSSGNISLKLPENVK